MTCPSTPGRLEAREAFRESQARVLLQRRDDQALTVGRDAELQSKCRPSGLKPGSQSWAGSSVSWRRAPVRVSSTQRSMLPLRQSRARHHRRGRSGCAALNPLEPHALAYDKPLCASLDAPLRGRAGPGEPVEVPPRAEAASRGRDPGKCHGRMRLLAMVEDQRERRPLPGRSGQGERGASPLAGARPPYWKCRSHGRRHREQPRGASKRSARPPWPGLRSAAPPQPNAPEPRVES